MKKWIALLLVLAMSLSLLGLSAQAAEPGTASTAAPFKLEATLDGNTVMLSLKTTEQLTYANMDFHLDCPKGFSLTEVKEGSDYSDFGVENVDFNGAYYTIIAKDKSTDTVVQAGKELMTYTVDAAEAAAGPHTFTVTFTAAGLVNGTTLPWEDATVTAEVTVQGLSIVQADYSDSTGTVRVTFPPLVKDAYLVVAFYNEAGRMVGIKMESLEVGATTGSATTSVWRTPSYVRAFLLTQDGYNPLKSCAESTISIGQSS
jgi:hypothetical protein